MKHNLFKRAATLLLALICVVGILPLSALAAGLSSAPGAITQKSCDYMYFGGSIVRYKAADPTVNSHGVTCVFNE